MPSKTTLIPYRIRIPFGTIGSRYTDTMQQANSKTVLRNSLALLMAIRCQSKEASRQLMASMYETMDEAQLKSIMLRLIYLLTPTERDWLRDLA